MPTEEESLTPEELAILEEAMKGAGSPAFEEKQGIHQFLNKVATSKDTTKLGNINEEELGFTPYSLRTYKTLELASKDLCNDDIWEDYFKKKGEILTATSLSKHGFLTGLAVIQRKQIEDVTKPKEQKENKGWFKKKDAPEVAQQ